MKFIKDIAVKILRKIVPESRNDGSIHVVVDLDRMIAKPVGVEFKGKIHFIKPMSQEVFMSTVNGMARLDMMRKRSDLTKDELINAYTDVFSKCCDTIHKKQVLEMTDAQIGAFFQHVIDCITGRAHADDQKKNIQRTITQAA